MIAIYPDMVVYIRRMDDDGELQQIYSYGERAMALRAKIAKKLPLIVVA